MEVAVFEQHLSQCRGVAITQEGVLDYNASPASSLQHLHKILHKHIGSFGCADVEVLKNLCSLTASKWGICQYHVLAVALLHIRHVLGKSVAMYDVRGCHTMEYHVHCGNYIW